MVTAVKTSNLRLGYLYSHFLPKGLYRSKGYRVLTALSSTHVPTRQLAELLTSDRGVACGLAY
jgi:hypothetical protein